MICLIVPNKLYLWQTIIVHWTYVRRKLDIGCDLDRWDFMAWGVNAHQLRIWPIFITFLCCKIGDVFLVIIFLLTFDFLGSLLIVSIWLTLVHLLNALISKFVHLHFFVFLHLLVCHFIEAFVVWWLQVTAIITLLRVSIFEVGSYDGQYDNEDDHSDDDEHHLKADVLILIIRLVFFFRFTVNRSIIFGILLFFFQTKAFIMKSLFLIFWSVAIK